MLYKERGRIRLNERKNIIVSTKENSIIIAQQIIAKDDQGNPINIFVKNAITMDLNSLKALNKVLDKVIKDQDKDNEYIIKEGNNG